MKVSTSCSGLRNSGALLETVLSVDAENTLNISTTENKPWIQLLLRDRNTVYLRKIIFSPECGSY